MKPRKAVLVRILSICVALLFSSIAAHAEVSVFTKTCVDRNGGTLCEGDWVDCTLHIEVVGARETLTITDLIYATWFSIWNETQGIPAPANKQHVNEGTPLTFANGIFNYGNVVMDPGGILEASYEAQVKAQTFGATRCGMANARNTNLQEWYSNNECVEYSCAPPNMANTLTRKRWIGPSPVVVGTPVTFEIEIENAGSAPDSNVRFQDLIDQVKFQAPSVVFSRQPDAGGANGYSIDATWNTLGVGEVITITAETIYANCTGSGQDAACNQGTTTSDAIDQVEPSGQRLSDNPDTPFGGDETCRPATAGGFANIVRPAVKEMVDVNGPPLDLGDTLHVTVTFENASFCETLAGEFQDYLPAQVDFVNNSIVVTPDSGNKSYNGGQHRVTVDQFTAGQGETTIEFDLTVNDNSGDICNTGQWRFGASIFEDTTEACVGSVSDRDGDTIPDDVDNCPDDFNDDQLDDDGDMVGNVCDNCPNDFNDNQLDDDSDTVGNVCDNCPNDSNPGQDDLDGDDVGDVCDPDIDGDGVDNATDCDPMSDQVWAEPTVLAEPVMADRAEPTRYAWADQAPNFGPGSVYDVAWGFLSDLSSDAGFVGADCALFSDLGTPEFQDARRPGIGEGFYYLVRTENACSTGTFGDSPMTPDPRDELDDLTNGPCP